ncbi:MAG: chemotaxis protein [Porticoccaceae bacterium]|nr:MAG: chemotaxis protein [Porticoccaceae bacterium]
MTERYTFSEDQRDCLQEVINVAIGQAGDALARFLEVFVRLSVPRIQLLGSEELPDLIQKAQFAEDKISAVRQGFSGIARQAVHGEAVVIYSGASHRELVELLGYETSGGIVAEAELLCDVSNILVGNCLSNLARQFDGDAVFSAPSSLLMQRPFYELTTQLSIEWESALLVEIQYALERGTFGCTLMLLMPNEVVAQLGALIDKILDEL